VSSGARIVAVSLLGQFVRLGELAIVRIDVSSGDPWEVVCDSATSGFEVSEWSRRSSALGRLTVALRIHRGSSSEVTASSSALGSNRVLIRVRLGHSVAMASLTVLDAEPGPPRYE
jgi:hypothetical protein